MHKRERQLAMLNDDRQVRPFEWGTEFIGGDPDAADPHQVFADFSKHTVENSDEYFSIPDSFDFRVNEPVPPSGADDLLSVPPAVAGGFFGADPPATAGGTDRDTRAAATATDNTPDILTWTSSITTPSVENNIARATYFPHETNRKAAVIILPHWNAKAGSYSDLCRFFNKVGTVSYTHLTLPTTPYV